MKLSFRWYGPKPPQKVLQFEKEFAARMQTRFALGVTSGTAALQCAVAALEIIDKIYRTSGYDHNA